MLNKFQGIGRLGADPELRNTSGGQSVCELRIALGEKWFDKNSNEAKERTEWVTAVVWGKTGENVAKFTRKGSLVYFEGRMQTRDWTTDSGEKRYKTEIVAHIVKFLDKKGEGGQGQTPPPAGKPEGADGSFSDSEIPF